MCYQFFQSASVFFIILNRSSFFLNIRSRFSFCLVNPRPRTWPELSCLPLSRLDGGSFCNCIVLCLYLQIVFSWRTMKGDIFQKGNCRRIKLVVPHIFLDHLPLYRYCSSPENNCFFFFPMFVCDTFLSHFLTSYYVWFMCLFLFVIWKCVNLLNEVVLRSLTGSRTQYRYHYYLNHHYIDTTITSIITISILLLPQSSLYRYHYYLNHHYIDTTITSIITISLPYALLVLVPTHPDIISSMSSIIIIIIITSVVIMFCSWCSSF